MSKVIKTTTPTEPTTNVSTIKDKSSSASSSSGKPAVTEDYEDYEIDFSHAFVKWDFCSDEEAVTVRIRAITKLVDEENEVEEEECFTFCRDNTPIDDDCLADIFEFIMNTEVGMPESYLVYVKDIINALLQDKTFYEQDDIRLLWDMNPDGEEPAVKPRVLTGATKNAVNAMVALEGMSYR